MEFDELSNREEPWGQALTGGDFAEWSGDRHCLEVSWGAGRKLAGKASNQGGGSAIFWHAHGSFYGLFLRLAPQRGSVIVA